MKPPKKPPIRHRVKKIIEKVIPITPEPMPPIQEPKPKPERILPKQQAPHNYWPFVILIAVFVIVMRFVLFDMGGGPQPEPSPIPWVSPSPSPSDTPTATPTLAPCGTEGPRGYEDDCVTPTPSPTPRQVSCTSEGQQIVVTNLSECFYLCNEYKRCEALR